jgi:prepilin-type N-terminal cleavage/methylation domain-containing protein
MVPVAAAGDSRAPGHPSAFTLIEMVAVLALIALLAALLLPRFIKRIDLTTRATEVTRLAAIADALKREVTRDRMVPDANVWRQAAAQWSKLSLPDVTFNARRYPRVYYFQTAPNPPDDISTSYLYSQTTNGTTLPGNLRAMVISLLGGPQLDGANCPNPNGGALSDADFDHLWNLSDGSRPTAGNWSAWTGDGDDFLVQRLDYAPLFITWSW